MGTDAARATEPFWETADPKIDDTGRVVRGGLWPAQRKWWELDSFIKGLVGGFGSGKTLAGGKRILANALQNAPCPVATVSPTFPVARQTVIATIKELLAGKKTLLGRRLYWKYNGTAHEFTIRYRGREAKIICYSGDDPDSLRGPNLASAWVDEPFIQSEEVFRHIIARIRHPNAELLELLLTGTPEQLNWGYDLCIGDYKEKHDVEFVQMDTRENKALSPDYVQRLLAAFDEKAAQAYVSGKFVNLATGLVYYGFDRFVNVVDLQQPESGVEFGVGMDFNVDPMSAVVFWRAGSHVHIIEEIELPNSDTQYLCQMLNEKYNKDRQRLTDVFPDASGSARKTSAPGGKSDFWYIEQAGFNVRAHPENPKRKDRYNAVNAKLKPSSNKIPTLTISPACKKLIKYLSVYSHELMNKSSQKAMSHLLDAFSYPIAYLFPVAKDTISVHKLQGV